MEHPFWKVKGTFHYGKARPRFLAKKHERLPALLGGLEQRFWFNIQYQDLPLLPRLFPHLFPLRLIVKTLQVKSDFSAAARRMAHLSACLTISSQLPKGTWIWAICAGVNSESVNGSAKKLYETAHPVR